MRNRLLYTHPARVRRTNELSIDYLGTYARTVQDIRTKKTIKIVKRVRIRPESRGKIHLMLRGTDRRAVYFESGKLKGHAFVRYKGPGIRETLQVVVSTWPRKVEF